MGASKDYQAKVDAEEKRQREQAEQNAAIISAETQRQVDALQQAQQERVQAQNEAQRIWQQRMDEGVQSSADLLAGYKRDIDTARAEMQQQVAQDQKAAEYTGFAELGSAIANLIGVGGHNAVSQQHKVYSQDWMKKADQDRREHRNRIDNLRERQRAVEQQINQLKLGNANAVFSNAMQRAEQRAQDRAALEQAKWNAVMSPLQYRQQAEDKAAQTALQGAYQAGHLAQGEAQLEERRRENEATMRSKGFNADGTPNETYMKQISANSSKSSTDAIPIIDRNGKVNVANLRPHELEAVLANAQSAIAKDLGEKEAAQFTKEFRKKIDDKAGQNAVLMEWMGKSKTCEEMLRAIDANYRGEHGSSQLSVGESIATPVSTPAGTPVQNDTTRGGSTGPLSHNDYLKKLGIQ